MEHRGRPRKDEEDIWEGVDVKSLVLQVLRDHFIIKRPPGGLGRPIMPSGDREEESTEKPKLHRFFRQGRIYFRYEKKKEPKPPKPKPAKEPKAQAPKVKQTKPPKAKQRRKKGRPTPQELAARILRELGIKDVRE